MLFDIKQFELFFRASTLKKGLQLFEKGALELVERHTGSEYHFSVKSSELHLKKRGDKLLAYTCSCRSKEYCEHLCAVLFYFQQEVLGIRAKRERAGSSSGQRKQAHLVDQEKLEKEELQDFVARHKQELSPAKIQHFISRKQTLVLSDAYALQAGQLIEPYLQEKKLEEKQIGRLLSSLDTLLKKNRQSIRKKADRFSFYLGFVRAFNPLFQQRFGGNEKPLVELYQEVLDQLDELFRAGLSAAQKKEWTKATLELMASNKSLHGEAFLFFVPRLAVLSRNTAVPAAQLEKRVYKIPYSHSFDKLLIARYALALKEKGLPGDPALLKQPKEVELTVAKAELELCSGHTDKAFKLLETFYEAVKSRYRQHYNDYLAYLLDLAHKYKKADTELKYLEESFVQDLFILPQRLERFLELLPKQLQAQKVRELVQRIKTRGNNHVFEKVSILYLKLDLLDDLVTELKDQHHKFNLVHTIVLKKLPDLPDAFLSLYINHLAEALMQDTTHSRQLKIFAVARQVFDKLPPAKRQEYLEKLVYGIGHAAGISRVISGAYGHLITETGS